MGGAYELGLAERDLVWAVHEKTNPEPWATLAKLQLLSVPAVEEYQLLSTVRLLKNLEAISNDARDAKASGLSRSQPSIPCSQALDAAVSTHPIFQGGLQDSSR